MEYSGLLLDRRWKKKARLILTRDHFKCTVCGSSKTLQVHHTFYYADYPDPWNYPDKSLLTLCFDCHLTYHLQHEVEVRIRKGTCRHKKSLSPIPPKPKLRHRNGVLYKLVNRKIAGVIKEVWRRA